MGHLCTKYQVTGPSVSIFKKINTKNFSVFNFLKMEPLGSHQPNIHH